MSDTPEFAAEPQVDTSYTGQIATLKEQLAAAQQTIDRLRGLLLNFIAENPRYNATAALQEAIRAELNAASGAKE